MRVRFNKKSSAFNLIKNIQWWIFLILVFSPKIVISSIPGLSSAFRVDLFLSAIYFSLFLFENVRHKSFYRKNVLALIVLGLIVIAYSATSRSVIIAMGQSFVYLSLFAAFIHGISLNQAASESRVKSLIGALLLNIAIHLLFYTFDFQDYLGTYVSDSGIDEVYTIFGRYGISSMPFQFSIYVVAFMFLLVYRSDIGTKLKVGGGALALMALLTGDSRIALGAIFVSIFGLKTIFIFPALLPVSFFLQTKTLSIFSTFSDIYSDPSLAMRLLNFDAYLDWLSLGRLAFGGGAQAFLEFSMQYGIPGPLDMGYIRVASEFGLLGILFLFIYLKKIIEARFVVDNAVALKRIMIFSALYFVLNEGLLATRSGHLMLFVFGLLCFRKISFASKPPIPVSHYS